MESSGASHPDMPRPSDAVSGDTLLIICRFYISLGCDALLVNGNPDPRNSGIAEYEKRRFCHALTVSSGCKGNLHCFHKYRHRTSAHDDLADRRLPALRAST
jgi:hypothetical protein